MSITITINLSTLAELKLTPSQYSYLICKHKDVPYPCANESVRDYYAKELERQGWLKITPDGIILREKTLKMLEENDNSPTSVENWIDEWRALWPKGVKSAGRPVIGNKKGVLKKMEDFCKEYPEYSKKQIFEATKLYVFEMSQKGFSYMTCADYFISKEVKRGDKTSLLAALLEDLEGKETILQNMEKGNGSDWHKEI